MPVRKKAQIIFINTMMNSYLIITNNGFCISKTCKNRYKTNINAV